MRVVEVWRDVANGVLVERGEHRPEMNPVDLRALIQHAPLERSAGYLEPI